jgi:hypothetical protein
MLTSTGHSLKPYIVIFNGIFMEMCKINLLEIVSEFYNLICLKSRIHSILNTKYNTSTS